MELLSQMNLESDSIVAVFLGNDNPEEAHKYIVQKVMDDYYPELTGWMAHQQIPERSDKCNTIEEIEALKFDLVPPDFFKVVLNRLSDEEALKPHKISDAAKVFLFSQITERIMFSAKQYMNNVLRQRAERIINSKPKIITS